jgi:hypothetical protein
MRCCDNRFKQLKKEEARKNAETTKKAVESTADSGDNDSDSEEGSDEDVVDLSNAKVLLEITVI